VLLGQDPDPVEAPIVREMYTRLARGDTLNALARDLQARGVRTRTGLVFSPQHIRDLVLRHTYAGIRAHATDGRPAHRTGWGCADRAGDVAGVGAGRRVAHSAEPAHRGRPQNVPPRSGE
jgi:hypothetical protein